MYTILTDFFGFDPYSSYKPKGVVRRVTVREKWLRQVVCHSEAHDGIGGGDEDEDGVPEVEEGGQGPKSFSNVCIIGTRFWYGRSCLYVMYGTCRLFFISA